MHAPTACIQSQKDDTLSTLDTWPLPCSRLENKFTPERGTEETGRAYVSQISCHPQLPDF
jgi:hypothetical protein